MRQPAKLAQPEKSPETEFRTIHHLRFTNHGNPMRILHVVPSYLPAWRYGGPIRSVHGLCRGLAALGHDVHVFTTNVDGPGDSAVPLGVPVETDGVKVWYFPSTRLRRLYWSPRMARALAAHLQEFDLVHLHSIFLWPTWAAARSARRAGVPYVVAPRGMLVRELIGKKSRLAKNVWIRLIERRNLEQAAGIHVTSRIEAEEAARFGFNLPPVHIVPNGVDMEDFDVPDRALNDALPEIAAGGRYLVFLSRINWKKGLDRLIPALARVPGISLVIAGNDEENYLPVLEELACRHGVRERIIFSGAIDGKDKATLLRNAAALVLPSYSENFGIVVLEAMAAGCPVAVTPDVGLAGTVLECGAGVVVEGEPAKLGEALKRMLSDPQALSRMGEIGRRVVAEQFTWEAVAKRMEKVYTGIIHV